MMRAFWWWLIGLECKRCNGRGVIPFPGLLLGLCGVLVDCPDCHGTGRRV
jgi:DnaJ-class molecular chaperone